MKPDGSIYEEIGVPTVVNAAGTKTRISGSLMRDEAADAMRDAARSFVRISDLMSWASSEIADATGAEAGYVTSGASAGLTLSAAACIAGGDLGAMAQLPKTEGLSDEIIMPRTHRNGYDHAFRVAGAELVDVGGNDHHLGTGGENTELWEIEDAITPETAAIGYMEKAYTAPPLTDVADVAHAHDVPVIVDAAAELPPKTNLSAFLDAGADLVVFSGGKAIRGPQSTGFVAGKEEYIHSIALQHLDMHTSMEIWDPPADLIDVDSLNGVPRHGIGRGLKVGKEEIVGAVVALTEFLETDYDERREEWTQRADLIADRLRDVSGIAIDIEPGGKTNVAPTVYVALEDEDDGAAATLTKALRQENPRIFVGSDDLDTNTVSINPMCLDDEEARYVVDRIAAHLD